jgi:bla regulator protein BlaR1
MIQAIVAHLWQSTLFAGAAWLAALSFGTNRAQVRYWVWFTASAKFLIPFCLLVGLGTLMPHRAAAPPIRAEWLAALQEFSQPLTPPTVEPQVAVRAGVTYHGYLAAAALALWACGFAAVAIGWLLRWRRIHALRRSARVVSVPTGLAIPVPIMSAPDLIEPGVFGVLRPVLLLPEGIAERLNQTQLDAILAHEFCHVRRKDNLTATIHMAVQAIFWFHPLTWWIGARLVDERERACDEEVLRLGCKPSVYAESILTICRLYLSSPIACVSGVTGSDLKRRIESIMRNRSVAGLTLGKKLALGTAAMAALVVPVVIGVLNAPAIRAQDAADWQTKAGGKMAFDVASVKLSKGEFTPPAFPLDAGDAYHPVGGHFRADFPLWTYIQFAYKIWPAEDQRREILAHLPGWVTADRYSIEARTAGNPTKDQMRLMIQSLLADRFKLAHHFETHEVPVFALTLVKPGKLGPKLLSHADGPACDAVAQPFTGQGFPDVFPPMCDAYGALRGPKGMLMASRNTTMDLLASSISGTGRLGRPVVDKTGLSGRFDFRLEWMPEPDDQTLRELARPADAQPPDSTGPTFPQALRDQLGLKLESTRAPIQILVVDKVERPSEN